MAQKGALLWGPLGWDGAALGVGTWDLAVPGFLF